MSKNSCSINSNIITNPLYDTYFEYEEDFDLEYCDTEPYISKNSTCNTDHYVSIEDGFNITRNNCGYLDLEYWAGITGYTTDEIIQLANGKLMWKDPEQYLLGADKNTGWITKEILLKGNRIRKYRELRELNQKTGLFKENLEVLKDNLPNRLAGEDIHVSLGSTWVLSIDGFISDFIAQLLDMSIPPLVEYDSDYGKWSIRTRSDPNYVLCHYTYGTSRMDALQILERKLNARPIKVNDPIYNYEKNSYDSVFNKEETLSAQEKSRMIDISFQDYCHGDRENETLLQEAYANWYGYGITKFDGDYLSLKNLPEGVTLYKHQKDAIAHILACHNVLLAHSVGTGKTYEYACGTHELMRLGMIHKALIIVPNATLEAAYRTYKELYPLDNVMLCRPKKEFSPKNRRNTLALIKEDNQIIFMAYSSFDMLRVSREYAFAKKDAELQRCREKLAAATDYYQKTELHARLKRLKKSVKKFKEEFKDTETACFDKLDFDLIVVDEAHNYKNIPLEYNYENIVGIHSRGSRKAANMLEKVRCIQERNGRVIFATGTPITNSLADLYILQYYLQPEELKICSIYHFNDWINSFCEEEQTFEIDVDSKNCRFTTRFSRFHNLPELMGMFSEVCDFYQGDTNELGLPEFHGYSDTVLKKSEAQKNYTDKLEVRAEAVRTHKVDRTEDNLLKITVHGRMAALDIRLVESNIIVTKDNKVEVCAVNIKQMYDRFPDCCQLVFSDISTPKQGFNIYDELKRKLIFLGINPKEIAFIHDAVNERQRINLEKRFNSGEIRILIGSTVKLGTGCNVQERLVAIHHLDVPWRPADMVQREGRILRQGNTCPQIFIFRYITEWSFDAYTYQILENKQKFISQFLSGSLSSFHRDETDCADTVLSYAEIKALAIGNPLIKERVKTSNMLEHARINQRQKKKELLEMEDLQDQLPGLISKQKVLIANTKKDLVWYEQHKEPVKKAERISFGEELLYALQDNIMHETERCFSAYQGFRVMLPKRMTREKPYVILKRAESSRHTIPMTESKILGCCQRLDHCLDHLDQKLEKQKVKLQEMISQEKQIQHDLLIGNSYDDEVHTLAVKLRKIDEKLKEGKTA